MILKFSNDMAQAWFRNRLNRSAAVWGISGTEKNVLLNIRSRSYGNTVELTHDEASLALSVCEYKVHDAWLSDPGLVEGRQAIVDQLKKGTS